MAYGEMGLSPRSFLFEMSLAQFTLTAQGYWKKQERLTLTGYQQVRVLAYKIYGMMGGTAAIEEFMPLTADAAPKQVPAKPGTGSNGTASNGMAFLIAMLGKEPTVVTDNEPESNR